MANPGARRQVVLCSLARSADVKLTHWADGSFAVQRVLRSGPAGLPLEDKRRLGRALVK